MICSKGEKRKMYFNLVMNKMDQAISFGYKSPIKI